MADEEEKVKTLLKGVVRVLCVQLGQNPEDVIGGIETQVAEKKSTRSKKKKKT